MYLLIHETYCIIKIKEGKEGRWANFFNYHPAPGGPLSPFESSQIVISSSTTPR
jgi:hypothetical protein